MDKDKWIELCKIALLSGVIAIVILGFTMMMFNKSWTLGGEKAILTWYEHLTNNHHNGTWGDSLLFIDMSSDKEIVRRYDDEGYKISTNVSVNHSNLYRILRELHDAGNYKFIMLDIFLDEEVSQPADTALYRLISTMPRIVIARSNASLADSCLYAKAGIVQYSTTLWENDFVKYPYWADGQRSMPLKMYEEMTGKSIKFDDAITVDEGQYVQTNEILTYNVVWDEELSESVFYTDMIYADSTCNQAFLPDDFDGKYVLIGDFEYDKHNTFMGEMPGVLINFNAYVSLVNGHHRLSHWYLFSLYFVFILLVILTIYHSRFARIVMWLGYPFILGAFGLFTYVCFNQVYDILSVTFIFYILEKLVYIWDYRRDICKWVNNHFLKIKETKLMKRLICLRKAILMCLCVIVSTMLYAGGKKPVKYRIISVNTPSIRIGHKVMKKGDVFNDTDTIYWIKDIRHKIVAETVKAPYDRYEFVHNDFKKYQKEGVKSVFDFFQVQQLGTRGINAQRKHYSEFDHYLSDTLLFSATTPYESDIRCEAVWSIGKKAIVTPVKRTPDGKFYIITLEIFKGKKPRNIKLSIREIDENLEWVNMVYQNIPIMYIPHHLGRK